MNELHLFSGAGGGILGGMLLGHTCVCAVEIEPYPRKVLLQRQRDGVLPKFPIWDDIRTFDGTPWRGKVDVVCGGFPCQDISVAGNGAGLDGARSGLWKEMLRVVCEIRPRYVFVENSPALLIRGLGTVLGDLAAARYNAKWGVFSGKHVGAPIERERIFIAGTDQKYGPARLGDFQNESSLFATHRGERPFFWVQAPPISFGMEHGMDSYMDQVSAIGNGQIPAVAALAFNTLTQ